MTELEIIQAADAVYNGILPACDTQPALAIAAAVGRVLGEATDDLEVLQQLADTVLLNAVMASTQCVCPSCGPVTLN